MLKAARFWRLPPVVRHREEWIFSCHTESRPEHMLDAFASQRSQSLFAYWSANSRPTLSPDHLESSPVEHKLRRELGAPLVKLIERHDLRGVDYGHIETGLDRMV